MKVEKLTNDELIQLVLDGKELTPSERLAVAALARRGAATQPKPIAEAPVDTPELFIFFGDGEYRRVDTWPKVWADSHKNWPDPYTHFIPLSALGTPKEPRS